MANEDTKLTPEQEAVAGEVIDLGRTVVGAVQDTFRPIVDVFDGEDTPKSMFADSDGDGKADIFEAIEDAMKTAPAAPKPKPKAKKADPNKDTDEDGITDVEEKKLGTNAKDPDTDRDGLSDFYEKTYGTNPLKSDSDGDGLGDQLEIHGSDPNDPDSDDDGLEDGGERLLGTDPMKADTDGDGVSDLEEVESATGDPLDPNVVPSATAPGDGSTGDDPSGGTTTDPGTPATPETPSEPRSEFPTMPKELDSDGDTIPDDLELPSISDPFRADTDFDGVRDDDEFLWKQSGAAAKDSDGDGLTDAAEARLGTAADQFDSDADGMSDLLEVRIGSDPTVSNRIGGDPYPNPTTDDEALRNLEARGNVAKAIVDTTAAPSATAPADTEPSDLAPSDTNKPEFEPIPEDAEIFIPEDSAPSYDDSGSSYDTGSSYDDTGSSYDDTGSSYEDAPMEDFATE